MQRPLSFNAKSLLYPPNFLSLHAIGGRYLYTIQCFKLKYDETHNKRIVQK